MNSQTTSSHAQDSFFSTLEWLDDTNSLQKPSQGIEEPLKNDFKHGRQASEHATHFNLSVSDCFYNFQNFTVAFQNKSFYCCHFKLFLVSLYSNYQLS